MSIEKAKLLTNNFKCGKILQKTTNKGYTKGYTKEIRITWYKTNRKTVDSPISYRCKSCDYTE